MDKLLPYYERELGQLRRAGAEFAGRYPRLAGTLQMRGESCADPQVERLLQAVAFLNARLAQRLDHAHAGFTDALLGMLYPHHLRPMPACSIARVDYSGAPKNAVGGVTVLPRGAALKSVAQGAVGCGFRTVYDAVVAPVAVSAAWFEPHIQVPPAMALPPDAGAAICITIESTGSARGLALQGVARMRVFIDAEDQLRAALRDALFMRAARACVTVGAPLAGCGAGPLVRPAVPENTGTPSSVHGMLTTALEEKKRAAQGRGRERERQRVG